MKGTKDYGDGTNYIKDESYLGQQTHDDTNKSNRDISENKEYREGEVYGSVGKDLEEGRKKDYGGKDIRDAQGFNNKSSYDREFKRDYRGEGYVGKSIYDDLNQDKGPQTTEASMPRDKPIAEKADIPSIDPKIVHPST